MLIEHLGLCYKFNENQTCSFREIITTHEPTNQQTRRMTDKWDNYSRQWNQLSVSHCSAVQCCWRRVSLNVGGLFAEAVANCKAWKNMEWKNTIISGVATGGHGWARAHPTSARVGREICTNSRSFSEQLGWVGRGVADSAWTRRYTVYLCLLWTHHMSLSLYSLLYLHFWIQW